MVFFENDRRQISQGGVGKHLRSVVLLDYCIEDAFFGPRHCECKKSPRREKWDSSTRAGQSCEEKVYENCISVVFCRVSFFCGVPVGGPSGLPVGLYAEGRVYAAARLRAGVPDGLYAEGRVYNAGRVLYAGGVPAEAGVSAAGRV